VVTVGTVIVSMTSSGPPIVTSSRLVAGTPEAGAEVLLDVTLYLPATTPAPAVLLAHGFGGSKADLASEARSLARHGYVVLAYTARGFGRSGGLIHLDAPSHEVADASKLISYLATLPQVRKDATGDPRVGVAGSSYGGGLALLVSAYDKRVDAVGADITWNDLTQALFPNGAGGQPGVFKKLWAGQLFASAAGQRGGACGRFAPDLCAAYQRAASTGQPDASILSLLRASSPAGVLNRITAPTLLSQGEQDSLFPLDQAGANARGIAANGTPVAVIWRSGGHDGGTSTSDLVQYLQDWFDPVLLRTGKTDTSFSVTVPGSGISSATGRTVSQSLQVDRGFTPGSEDLCAGRWSSGCRHVGPRPRGPARYCSHGHRLPGPGHSSRSGGHLRVGAAAEQAAGGWVLHRQAVRHGAWCHRCDPVRVRSSRCR
jgi:ABC-2 type transport system ATP-binding protein